MPALPSMASLPASLQLIVWLYLITNAARIFTYVPQIHAVWRDHQGARTLSLLTWGSWVLSHLCALAYAQLVVHDAHMALISSINVLGAGCVTLVAARRRLQWLRARQTLSLGLR